MKPETRRTPAVALMVLLVATLSATAQAGSVAGQVTVLDKAGRPLPRFDHAVVYVMGLESPPPDVPAVLDQRNKEFVPRLLPVIRGQEVRFPNSDPLQHNVFSPHEQEPFDLGLYASGDSRSVRLNVLGRHKVYCNLHKSMVADILVLPNRYFALTDAAGRYRIEGLPPGEYEVRVWHVFGGSDQQTVRVAASDAKADFTVRSAQSPQELSDHPDKTGKGYAPPPASTDSY